MAKASKPKKDHSRGPYLDAALICDQVIHEKDGTYSYIRQVNRLIIHDAAPPPGSMLILPLFLVVSFKAGDVQGDQEMMLYVVSPSRKRFKPYRPSTLTFQGGDSGVVASCPVIFPYETDGTYWIEIVLARKRYSRIPLTLSFKPSSEADSDAE